MDIQPVPKVPGPPPSCVQLKIIGEQHGGGGDGDVVWKRKGTIRPLQLGSPIGARHSRRGKNN